MSWKLIECFQEKGGTGWLMWSSKTTTEDLPGLKHCGGLVSGQTGTERVAAGELEPMGVNDSFERD